MACPATPGTVGRKVTEYLATREKLRAFKSDLRQMLCLDDDAVQFAEPKPRARPEDSNHANPKPSSSGGKPGTSTEQPTPKGILKANTVVNLVEPEVTVDSEDSTADEATVLCSDDDSESDDEPKLTKTEEKLCRFYLKGHGKVLKWFEVIEQTKDFILLKCRVVRKGKVVYKCPDPECSSHYKEWTGVFEHYVEDHFKTFSGEEVKPMCCPINRCTQAFTKLMGFFGHIVKDHQGSKMHGTLVTVYQDHGILPST